MDELTLHTEVLNTKFDHVPRFEEHGIWFLAEPNPCRAPVAITSPWLVWNVRWGHRGSNPQPLP